MAYEISSKARKIVPYEPVTGRVKVRLDANESFLPMHPDIKRDVISQIRKVALHRYPDPKAEKCCKAFASHYGVDPALVTAGNGSDELIGLILGGFFAKGERILITEPDFSMYEFYANLAELEVVRFQKKGDFKIETAELIAFAQQEKVRGLIFSNPCNPTSQGIRKLPMRMIVSGLPDTLVILDEAYMDFWNQSMINEVAEYDNLILLRTMSKAMGSAGIRLGFAVSNKKLTKVLRGLKAPYNVSSLTQAAALGVFKHPEISKDAVLEIMAGRGFLSGALMKLEMEWKGSPFAFRMIPESRTNFVTICFEDEDKHKEIFEALKKKGILIRCFPAFLRITVGSSEENAKFLDELRALHR